MSTYVAHTFLASPRLHISTAPKFTMSSPSSNPRSNEVYILTETVSIRLAPAEHTKLGCYEDKKAIFEVCRERTNIKDLNSVPLSKDRDSGIIEWVFTRYSLGQFERRVTYNIEPVARPKVEGEVLSKQQCLQWMKEKNIENDAVVRELLEWNEYSVEEEG